MQSNVQGGYIYVDESGDPGLNPSRLQKKPYFVFGYVYVQDPADLNKRLKRLLKRLHRKDKYPSKLRELKFYLPHGWMIKHGYTNAQFNAYVAAMPDVRKQVLDILAAHTNGVFAAVVDKHTAHNRWTSERLGNYTFAQTLLLGVMREVRSHNPPTIIYDKGRLSHSSEVSFDSYLLYKQIDFAHKHHMPQLLTPKTPHSVSSIYHPGIWAADYVAGAFYYKYQTGNAKYADMLKQVWLGKGEKLYWKRRIHGNPNWT
ncbi:MAG: DUF3800 domain-containing protein [Gemmatimonadetes bacterium]|nr:DUF3800 domain-containing protein [Gemmatimonadota bacterium]